MYCLVMFLHAHEKGDLIPVLVSHSRRDPDWMLLPCVAALKDTRPVAKLLCVKAVVFFTFWQVSALARRARLFVLADLIRCGK